jgi:hypothetical protein
MGGLHEFPAQRGGRVLNERLQFGSYKPLDSQNNTKQPLKNRSEESIL